VSYTKITIRYAAAFFDLAEEKGTVEKANEDMALLGSVCNSNPEFVRMLQNPVVHADKKIKVLSKVFGSSVSPVTLGFFNLMIRKRRERYLPSIAEAFADLYQASKGVKTAYVTSAVSLDDKEKTGVLEILSRLTDKKIELVEKTNEALIGGFIINLDNFQIDQRIATKIKELKKDFEKNLFKKGF
jgi:F-type H+-transporting ATPase subunit delta